MHILDPSYRADTIAPKTGIALLIWSGGQTRLSAMARGIRERAFVEDAAIFLSMGVIIAISRSGAAMNEKPRDAKSTRPKRVCSTCGQPLS